MIAWIINLFASPEHEKQLATAQGFLNGQVTNLATLIAALVCLIALMGQFCALHGLGEVFNWAMGLGANPDAQKLVVAITAFGIGRKLSKNTEAVLKATPPTLPPAAPDTKSA